MGCSAVSPLSGGGTEHPSSAFSRSVASYVCHFMLTCDIPMTHNNDRSVNGVRYFRCRPRHGAFFRPDVLTLVAKRPPTARDITKASSLYKQGPRNVVSPEIV